MKHLFAILFAGVVAIACATPSILDNPSTMSGYPCGSPTLKWCDVKQTACCDADEEECCDGTHCPAGLCEATSASPGEFGAAMAPRRRPQIQAR